MSDSDDDDLFKQYTRFTGRTLSENLRTLKKKNRELKTLLGQETSKGSRRSPVRGGTKTLKGSKGSRASTGKGSKTSRQSGGSKTSRQSGGSKTSRQSGGSKTIVPVGSKGTRRSGERTPRGSRKVGSQSPKRERRERSRRSRKSRSPEGHVPIRTMAERGSVSGRSTGTTVTFADNTDVENASIRASAGDRGKRKTHREGKSNRTKSAGARSIGAISTIAGMDRNETNEVIDTLYAKGRARKAKEEATKKLNEIREKALQDEEIVRKVDTQLKQIGEKLTEAKKVKDKTLNDAPRTREGVVRTAKLEIAENTVKDLAQKYSELERNKNKEIIRLYMLKHKIKDDIFTVLPEEGKKRGFDKSSENAKIGNYLNEKNDPKLYKIFFFYDWIRNFLDDKNKPNAEYNGFNEYIFELSFEKYNDKDNYIPKDLKDNMLYIIERKYENPEKENIKLVLRSMGLPDNGNLTLKEFKNIDEEGKLNIHKNLKKMAKIFRNAGLIVEESSSRQEGSETKTSRASSRQEGSETKTSKGSRSGASTGKAETKTSKGSKGSRQSIKKPAGTTWKRPSPPKSGISFLDELAGKTKLKSGGRQMSLAGSDKDKQEQQKKK